MNIPYNFKYLNLTSISIERLGHLPLFFDQFSTSMILLSNIYKVLNNFLPTYPQISPKVSFDPLAATSPLLPGQCLWSTTWAQMTSGGLRLTWAGLWDIPTFATDLCVRESPPSCMKENQIELQILVNITGVAHEF